MITDPNKIHYIVNIKTLSQLIRKQWIEFNDPKTFMGYSKKRKKYIMKKYRQHHG